MLRLMGSTLAHKYSRGKWREWFDDDVFKLYFETAHVETFIMECLE